MNKEKLFECSLGFHEYEIKILSHILLCKHCKRFGYYKDSDGYERWYEYNKNGDVIHYKDNKGYERWYEYDKNRNVIHFKNSWGLEKWLHKGNWVFKKPENWEYENLLIS